MFNSQAYSLEQIMAFSFADKKLLGLFVKEIEGKNYEKKFKVVSVLFRVLAGFTVHLFSYWWNY
jgi:hypothetical protein